MKKVLIVTYYWPPAGGPGVQRVLKFVKFLPKLGWEPIVLTVRNGEYPAIDETLAKNIPEGCKVFKSEIWEPASAYKKFMGMKSGEKIPTAVLADETPSLKKKIASIVRLNLFVPDAKIGWINNAVKTGKEIIRTEKPDLIFSSSPPPTVHLIARRLAKYSKLKWIADFRDPWTDIHYYENQPRLSVVKAFDRMLEKKVLTEADRISCISKLDIDLDFGKKTNPGKCCNIPNGYDEEDFSELKLDEKNDNRFEMLHLGAVNKERVPHKLLRALKTLNEEGVILEKLFQLKFVGKTEEVLKQEVEQLGINDLVKFVSYVPHSEALKHIESASVMLLLVTQSDKNKRILPGKTFEYIRTGREILALGPTDGEVARIINSTKTGKMIDYSDETDLYEFVKTRFLKWKNGDYSFERNVETILEYSRENLTKKLIEQFESLIK